MKENFKITEDLFAAIKNYYLAMFICPILIVFMANIAIGLHIKSDHLLFNFITGVFSLSVVIISLLWIIYLACYFIYKKMIKTFLYFITIFIFTLTLSISPVIYSRIDADWINIFLYKSEYLRNFEKQFGKETNKVSKLVKIKKESSWIGCNSYIVYDEKDQISKQYNIYENKVVKGYGDHLYIEHYCFETN